MAGISIQINPGTNLASSSVSASGFFQHVISGSEVNSFGLQDDTLKNAVWTYFAKRPNDAYLKDPTPWNNLYSTYGWPQTQTTIVPLQATIVDLKSVPSIVAQQRFSNKSNKVGTFNVSVTQQVNNTATSTWNVTKTVEVSQTINYGLSFLGTGGGGSTTMSYSQAWAQGGSNSESVTLGSTQAVAVELLPGQSVDAQLTASRGTLTVEIVYQATLGGVTAVNYDPRYKDHHFWALDLPSVMQVANIPNVIQFTETITIDYFMNAELVLSEIDGTRIEALAARAGDGETLIGETA